MYERECELINLLGEWAGTDGEELCGIIGKKFSINRIDDAHYQAYIGLQACNEQFWVMIFDDIDETAPSLIMPFAPNKLGTIASCILNYIDNNV